MNNFEKNETQCLYGEMRTPSDKVVVEECPECGSEVWLKRDEKTGEWTRETGGKMNVSWINMEGTCMGGNASARCTQGSRGQACNIF